VMTHHDWDYISVTVMTHHDWDYISVTVMTHHDWDYISAPGSSFLAMTVSFNECAYGLDGHRIMTRHCSQ